jgi:ribosome-associated protein
MSEATAKKNVQKLQRIIVDALEDVKAQDVVVFDTEHLSSLFERVIVASGTSNRQTKALSASVRDKVRDAGFPKPRIEGEDNGEWIIVDCGQAVAHIMQPAIRQYYNLEEIWGEKPVRLKHGADKVVAKPLAKKASSAKGEVKSAKSATGAQPAAAKKAAAKSTKPKAVGAHASGAKGSGAKSTGTKTTGAKSAKPKAAAPAKKAASSPRAKAAPQAKAAKPRA